MEALAPYPQPTMQATATAPATHSYVDKIRQALNNDNYDWRTIDGISKETGISANHIENVLETQLQDEVIRSSVRDAKGRTLYTARSRYKERRGLVGRFISALSDQVK